MFNKITLGPITVYMYGLMIAIGFASALFLCNYRGKKRGLSEDTIFGIFLCALIGGMVGCRLLYYIVELPAIIEDPSRIKSQDLIGQMSAIQRSNRGTIKSNTFSDMFMAACFCAYVRKMTQLQIAPLLEYSNVQISQNFFSSIKSTAELMNTKLIIQADNKNQISSFIDKPRTVQEDEMLTHQYHQQH